MPDLAAFYEGKTLLITGATGFLGKPLVEKILRQLPGVRRAYLLVRAGGDDPSAFAQKRLEQEILRSHVFTRLREQHGDGWKAFAADKVQAVPGDVSLPNLGLSDENFARLTAEIDIVINSAAVVVFDERLDYAVESNTLGPTRILEFVKQCRARGGRDPIFLHVSTAYVGGLQAGRIPEALPRPGRCVFEVMGRATEQPFDLDEQIRDIIVAARAIDEEAQRRETAGEFTQEALRALQNGRSPEDACVREEAERRRKRWMGDRLVNEGLARARRFGWNDTYTFTKALGEQMLAAHRDDVPTIILRPSIIESSYAEPEPGWIDGFRMADPLIIGYGKGRIPDFPADLGIILDIIPVDHVVNSLLAAIPTAATNRGLQVYQVATSSENPLHFRALVIHTHEYFIRYPMRERSGKPIVPKQWTFPSEQRYGRWIAGTRAKLAIAHRVCGWLSVIRPLARMRRELAIKQAGLERLAYYNQIYGHYVRLHCQYETTNTRALYHSLSRDDQRSFLFSPSAIDWQEYLQEIHIPGLKRHVLKMDEEAREPLAEDDAKADIEPEGELLNLNNLLDRAARRWPDKVALQIKRDGEWSRLTFGDLRHWSRVVANGLRARGVVRGDRIVFVSENQPEWVVAYFACSALGAAVVPIDRQTRAEEVFAIADFVEARAVVGSASWLAKVKVHDGLGHTVLNMNRQFLPFDEPTCSPDKRALEPADVEPDEIASIIFTTGTAVEPRGAMLSHRNLLANVLALADVLQPYETDQMLGLLPLNHAFEFTCDLLVPLLGGATVTYVESMKSREVLRAMNETGTTCLLGIPRVFEILLDSIQQRVASAGALSRAAFGGLKLLSALSQRAGRPQWSRRLFASVHEAFGGRLRLFISGGAALDPRLHRDFTLMGFNLCEGYGLTETAPVLTVNPLENSKRGSVGRALPGVRLRIVNPDANGIGEIVTRGPNVFAGYYRNEQATGKVLRDEWFHTGDLGYLDTHGYLFITGRIKEVIVTPAGKNVYPDEVEALFRHVPGVREICVLGVRPCGQLGEEVHAVIVSESDEASVVAGVQEMSRAVPSYQRLQRIHFWKDELPKTAALQVDRLRVKELLIGAATVRESPQPSPATAREAPEVAPAVIEVLSRVTRVPGSRLTLDSNLQFDLAMDSMMRIEMILALETRFRVALPEEQAMVPQSVREVVEAVERALRTGAPPAATAGGNSYWDRALVSDETLDRLVRSPGPLTGLMRAAFRRWLRRWYEGRLGLKCHGLEQIPNGAFIIAPNHSSHLDSGAVLVALESVAPKLRILGARDYFFNTRLKGWFCRTLLDVVPFDRQVNFVEGLRVGRQLLQNGNPLLIFPEGTRSTSGQLQSFKPGIGLLAFELDVPIVPAYISGAFVAWPKGRRLPGRGQIAIRFGAPIRCDRFRAKAARDKAAEAMPYDIYQAIVAEVRAAVEQLRTEA